MVKKATTPTIGGFVVRGRGPEATMRVPDWTASNELLRHVGSYSVGGRG